MKDFYNKINWLRVLLATVTAIALSAFFVLLSKDTGEDAIIDLVQNVIPDLVAVLIAIPIIYFLFTIKGLSPQQELIDNIVEKVNSSSSNKKDFWISDFPPDVLDMDLATADEITFVGLYLSRTIQNNWVLFQNLLSKGTKFHFVVLDFKDIELVKRTRVRYLKPLSPNSVVNTIQANLDQLLLLKSSGDLSISLTSYALPFGGILITKSSKVTKLYVKIYGYKIEPLDFHKMILDPKDGKIFLDYLQQFNSIIQDTTKFTKFE